MLLTSSGFSQEVSNVRFEQVGKKIHIYYDLLTTTKCKVKIYYNTNVDNSWTRLKKVNGDIGIVSISGHNKLIVWDILKDIGNTKGVIRFKVTVDNSTNQELSSNYSKKSTLTKNREKCYKTDRLINYGSFLFGEIFSFDSIGSKSTISGGFVIGIKKNNFNIGAPVIISSNTLSFGLEIGYNLFYINRNELQLIGGSSILMQKYDQTYYSADFGLEYRYYIRDALYIGLVGKYYYNGEHDNLLSFQLLFGGFPFVNLF